MIRQIRSTLFPAEKFALIRISGLVFLASLLELGGIGLVMPIIALFLNPELFDQNRILIQIKQMTGNLPYNSLLILLCTATALFFLCKNLFLYWIAGVQIRFAYRLSARLGADLLKRYIGGGYRFRLNESTARSLEKLNQTRNALPDLFNSLMMLASEVLLVMILLAVVKRKNRKLPGLIFQLAAGAVLAVAGAVLLAGPLMMGSRERTLADQRNYVAVRLMEMGDYANGASMAAQADQLSPNDASKQLMSISGDTGKRPACIICGLASRVWSASIFKVCFPYKKLYGRSESIVSPGLI